MLKLPVIIAGVGALAACTMLQTPALQSDVRTALERACIAAPGDPWAWQRLGEHLLAQGDAERATRMLKQADSLREHTLMDDYATLLAARDAARSSAAAAMAANATAATAPSSSAGWPADMPRTELRTLGPALLALHRVERSTAPAQPLLAVRLEISNGNGVRGLAAAWARSLRSDELALVRLSNIRPFAEPSSRIEYRAENAEQAQRLAGRIGVPAVEGNTQIRRGSPDMRLVLGLDLRTAVAEIKKPPTGSGRRSYSMTESRVVGEGR
jgi:hypothetical protein